MNQPSNPNVNNITLINQKESTAIELTSLKLSPTQQDIYIYKNSPKRWRKGKGLRGKHVGSLFANVETKEKHPQKRAKNETKRMKSERVV